MSGFEYEEYKPCDLFKLNPREIDMEWIGQITQLGNYYGPGITGFLDGIALFCAGLFINKFIHTADAWVVCDKSIDKHWERMFITLSRELAESFERYDLNRIQIVLKKSSTTCMRLAEALSFKKEGVLVGYANGEDCIMYGRVM
jgi:hypothetical protein